MIPDTFCILAGGRIFVKVRIDIFGCTDYDIAMKNIFKNIRKKNRISYVTDDEYEYCRYCEANLTLQKGYSNDLPYWVCKGCGQMLINPNLNTDSDIIWTCDGCETLLNEQPGFTEKNGSWKCTACGFVNSLDKNHVYVSEDEYQAAVNAPYNGISNEDMLALMSYEVIGSIENREDVLIVKDEDGNLYVEKILDTFDESIYQYLMEHPIANMPQIMSVYRGITKLVIIEQWIDGVTIEDMLKEYTIMEVNDSAFSSSEYKNLVINNSNLTIGENAFAYNDKAESVTILNSECSLDEYALYNTGKHMTIGITDSTIVMEDSAVSGSNEDILLVYNSKIDMGSNAFAYSDDITDVKFENCEITMDEYTFYATGDSASVVFDECDITMQDSALSGNEFETLDMLNCVALEMGDNAIAYSDDLESVNISGTDMKIGEYAFYNDDNLAEITINAGNGQIELKDSAFSGLGDDCEKISITCGTIKMGDDVFAYNDGLLAVSITGTIEKKGSYIFYNCPDDLVINVNGETFNEDTFEEKEY